MAWTGSRASRASRFHARKYQLDPRASVAARARFTASRTRLSQVFSRVRPR